MSEVSVTPKSARKRIIFSRSFPDESSSDDTLGHMSPLSSSPDRYSSPPPSPQWLTETPPAKLNPTSLNDSTYDPDHRTPKANRSLRVLGTSVFKGPQKKVSKKVNENSSVEMELVEESPLKDSTQTGLMTPFKCLVSKENDVERTPQLKLRKLIIGESPDISSVAAPVKLLNKFRAVESEPTPEMKSALPNTHPVKLQSLSTSSFYSSRARASLFAEQLPKPVSSILDTKRKRSKSAESFHSHRHFAGIQVKSHIKRRKLGEINVGVSHRIKKSSKKMKKPVINRHSDYRVQPKITPADRIISCLDQIDSSLLNSLNTDEENNVQEAADSTNNISIITEAAPDPVERVPSPPPDPTKKFFKTKRTLQLNSTATITVDKNIKIKVSNGKYFLNKPEGKAKTKKNGKEKTGKSTDFEPIGEEKSKAEVVQEIVHDNVERLLQKLVESPVKDDGVRDNSLLSPNHQITALATSTSSLVISDEPENQQLAAEQVAQMLNTPSKGIFEELLDDNMGEKENNSKREKESKRKYYPVFYKSSSAKKLADLSNVNAVKTPRGVKRSWRSTDEDQYIIDAGQKKFGATQCKECGLLYQYGDPDDELIHEKVHSNSHILKYSILKNERVVAYYGPDKVVLVKSSDSKSWLNKVDSVMKLVDEELGYFEAGIWNRDSSQVYLYVMERQIAGCVVVHPIQEAHKMLSNLVESCDCCSEEAYPAKCAISRIWVNAMHRRKRIASKLLDSIRSCFIQGYVIAKDEIAFSAPTLSGKAFAEKYTGTDCFLVYT